MKRTRSLGLLLVPLIAAASTSLSPERAQAAAAEPEAEVRGVADRTLRLEVERAIPEAKGPPDSRIEARRRARTATEAATALLRSEGYYDYEITSDLGEGERPVPVLDVKPGPRTRLAEPRITFLGPPPDEAALRAARAALKLPAGDPARAADILAAEGRVIAALQAAGYADAAATDREVVIDHADQTAHVDFRVRCGALVRLDGLIIRAKGRSRESFIRKLVPWRPGQVYSPKLVAELERRLLDTHVYDSVTVALAPPAEAGGLRSVIVGVADRTRNSLSVEAGYSSTEGGDVDIRLAQYDRFGLGDTLTYGFRLGSIDSRIGVDWSLPDFLKPGQTLTLDPALFQSVTNAFRETGARFMVDATQRYGVSTYFTRGASVTASEVDDFHTGKIRIVSLRLLGAFALDETDNPLNPHHGFKVDARLEPTLITLGESLVYLKAQAQASTYLPLTDADVIAVRGHIGSILGGSIPAVPASDRFYAGGGGTVRGYEYQNVGPHYSDNVPIGGLSEVDATVEFRHWFTKTLGGVAFADTGSVSEQTAPDFKNTFTSVGLGLRYNLGFAPLRADVAFPLQTAISGQQPFQVYLSIGQSF